MYAAVLPLCAVALLACTGSRADVVAGLTDSTGAIGQLDIPSCDATAGTGQACAWTGPCAVAGCAEACVINTSIGDTEKNINELLMRQNIDVIACPLIASFIQPYAGDLLKSGSKPPALTTSAARRLFGAAAAGSPGDGGGFKCLQELRASLLGIAAQAASEGGEGLPLRHLLQATPLGQGCPTDEAIDDAAGHSRLTAMAYQAVLAGYSDYDFDFVSGPFTEGTQEYAFVEFLVKVLGDPAATKAFFADQCASAAVSGALSPLYAGLQRLPPGASSVTACRDKGNGAEDLLAGMESISQACDLTGSDVAGMACLGEEAAPLDDACFATYSSVLGIPAAAAADLQAPFKAIHTACAAITTESACVEHTMVEEVAALEATVGAIVNATTGGLPPIGGALLDAPAVELAPEMSEELPTSSFDGPIDTPEGDGSTAPRTANDAAAAAAGGDASSAAQPPNAWAPAAAVTLGLSAAALLLM